MLLFAVMSAAQACEFPDGDDDGDGDEEASKRRRCALSAAAVNVQRRDSTTLLIEGRPFYVLAASIGATPSPRCDLQGIALTSFADASIALQRRRHPSLPPRWRASAAWRSLCR